MVEVNQIYHMDCLELIDRMIKERIKVDCIIADPPYNLSKSKGLSMSNVNKLKGFGGDWKITNEDWDNMSFEDYWNFLYTWLKKSKQIMKPSSTIWVFGTYHNIGLVNTMFQLLNIEILNEIIWYKRNAFPNLTCSRFTASHESILWGHLPTEKNEYTFNYDIMKDTDFPEDKLKEKGKQMRDVWDIPNNKTKEELQYKHPTQKPERLIRRCILASTKEGDLVFDPFGGSFTTAKVAKELGRRFISCDINDKYVEIGKKRINDLIHKLNC